MFYLKWILQSIIQSGTVNSASQFVSGEGKSISTVTTWTDYSRSGSNKYDLQCNKHTDSTGEVETGAFKQRKIEAYYEITTLWNVDSNLKQH